MKRILEIYEATLSQAIDYNKLDVICSSNVP